MLRIWKLAAPLKVIHYILALPKKQTNKKSNLEHLIYTSMPPILYCCYKIFRVFCSWQVGTKQGQLICCKSCRTICLSHEQSKPTSAWSLVFMVAATCDTHHIKQGELRYNTLTSSACHCLVQASADRHELPWAVSRLSSVQGMTWC